MTTTKEEPDFTDAEIAVAVKALDIHRQSLANKLRNRLGPNDQHERRRARSDVMAATSASSKLKAIENGRLRS